MLLDAQPGDQSESCTKINLPIILIGAGHLKKIKRKKTEKLPLKCRHAKEVQSNELGLSLRRHFAFRATTSEPFPRTRERRPSQWAGQSSSSWRMENHLVMPFLYFTLITAIKWRITFKEDLLLRSELAVKLTSTAIPFLLIDYSVLLLHTACA